jgi:hypothetical protein
MNHNRSSNHNHHRNNDNDVNMNDDTNVGHDVHIEGSNHDDKNGDDSSDGSDHAAAGDATTADDGQCLINKTLQQNWLGEFSFHHCFGQSYIQCMFFLACTTSSFVPHTCKLPAHESHNIKPPTVHAKYKHGSALLQLNPITSNAFTSCCQMHTPLASTHK